MELVSRIVICDMDAALYLFNREYSMFLDDVPSLLSIPVHQVDSLAVYTIGNNPDISKVYTKLSARYSQVSECDYTILGLVTQVPTVLLHSQRLRNFTLYRSHALFDDLDISNFLSHAHNLCSISLLGEGRFSLDWTQKTHGPFHSVHLTRLTLDYASSAGTVTSAPSQLAPFRIPNLKSLLVSFHIAHMLFCVQYLDDLFPTPTPTSATAFPKLTDLTLVDIRVKHDPIQYNHLSGGRYDGIAPFPTLPLLHMPRLTRLIVPSEHRTCAFSQTLSYAQLIQMTAEATMLQVLRLPSVIELTGCPNPPESGQDHAHRPVWPSIEFLEVNWRIMDRVGECVKFPHAKWRCQGKGSVTTHEGHAVVFPNLGLYQHKVASFELKDKSRPGYRKIVALFLVDPEWYDQVWSTALVPLQQADWVAREEAKGHKDMSSAVGMSLYG
ncbi:hypothetical protein BCR44DRAFT_58812 [Catenaria anguillulae PL171]|uniref:DUF4246 domain-containing protein n=1 Tax=Catenaria anguillulae PL171 TaxID=765915 RepID=A0A1Y2HA39_9FUNG|nr:hypothetical protein BCR44DRAFT_58812 [Catenaria anguillulae PL171]